MNKLLMYLLGFMLLIPTFANAFELSLVPYSQIRVYSSGETRPLWSIGGKLLAEDWPVKNLGVYGLVEWGQISKKETEETGGCSWWAAGEGCKQWDTWINTFRQADRYTAVMIGIQYKIKLFEK